MAINNLTGKKFGRLTVIEDSGKRSGGKVVWLCLCDCGNKKLVRSNNLISGNTKSCGCFRKEKMRGLGKEGSNWEKSLKKRKETFYKEKTYIPMIDLKKPIKTNTSGTTGVYWISRRKRWLSTIIFQGRLYSLGYFENKNDAIDARKEAEETYFKPILEKYKKD